MVPYDQIDTLFLDVGNTLVSIDFDWIVAEIGSRGITCRTEELRRAEAAARPDISARIAVLDSREPSDPFRFYLSSILSRVESIGRELPQAFDSLVSELVPVLWQPGRADRLWRLVLPGVPEALEAFRALGLRLVVVSNADGTVERGLVEQGLRPYFHAVIDSAVVGFEKPDPRIFQHAVAESGADPRAVLHVGDLLHADVHGARAAGLHALLLDPFGDWSDVGCERLPDLPSLAERLRESRRPPAAEGACARVADDDA